jgi:hypothetical protein
MTTKTMINPIARQLARFLAPLSLILITTTTRAQTKIFKEVGEDIATEIKAIYQDNSLVGYLAFTRLERVDQDSFNYRITIMDENLNDIGKLNFRERGLQLEAVSFEQDILCLGYVESVYYGATSNKELRQAYKHRNEAKDQLVFQFISLQGKIVSRYTTPVELSSTTASGAMYTLPMFLFDGMQIRNIAGHGFAVFYGANKNQRELLLLDPGGKLIRRKKISVDCPFYLLGTSGSNIYLLTKMNIRAAEGGYQLYTYSAGESTKEFMYELKDKKGNWLKALSFENDPTTGQAFIAGCVINQDREKDFTSAHDYAKGAFVGLFCTTLGGTKEEIKTTYSYWDTETIPGINKDGLFAGVNEFFAKFSTAFKDFKGNTVFVGSALNETRLLGAAKYRFGDAVFVTQDNKGALKLDNHIPCDEGKYFGPAGTLFELDHKSFYKVVNQDTHTTFIIVDDIENTYIYNFNSKKLVRTIQHKDGRIKTRVYPAKEGHIMVSEYNSKERSTRFSIEAL